MAIADVETVLARVFVHPTRLDRLGKVVECVGERQQGISLLHWRARLIKGVPVDEQPLQARPHLLTVQSATF